MKYKAALRLLLCALSLILLTGCGTKEAGEAVEKDYYYEVLDSSGTALYTVGDGQLMDALDTLLGTPMEDTEPSGGAGDIEALYTYVYWQEKTLLAGEGPAQEREYEELLHTLVPAEGDTVVIQVLPGLEDLEGASWLTDTVDLEELLTSQTAVSPEVLEVLRNPARFVET